MKNWTIVNESSHFYTSNRSYNTANLAISVACMVIAFYTACVVIYHEIAVDNIWKRKEFLRASPAKIYKGLSRVLCVLIAILSLLRNIITTTEVLINNTIESDTINFRNLTYNLNDICPSIPRAGISVLMIGLSLVYLFLWLRQRLFYTEPLVKDVTAKVAQWLSNCILVIWVIYLISISLSYFLVVDYEYSDRFSCVTSNSTESNYESIIWSWAVVSVLMQIILLGLFIHPLYKQNSWSKKAPGQKPSLQKRIKKAVILAAICLASDITLPLLTKVFITPDGDLIFTFYNINLVVNQLATVACFDNWKAKIFPWKSYKKKNEPPFLCAKNNSGTIEVQT